MINFISKMRNYCKRKKEKIWSRLVSLGFLDDYMTSTEHHKKKGLYMKIKKHNKEYFV